jgi:hypothetical protein
MTIMKEPSMDLATLHPAIIRCPIPVGDLPERSGYARMLGVSRSLHARLSAALTPDGPIAFAPPSEFEPRRYVALAWGAGDEAELDDGRVAGMAPDWGAFLAFLHGEGWPWIVAHGLDFGSGDGPPARHWLVCDRLTGAGWAMPWRWASRLVRTQASDDLRRAIAGLAGD